MSIITARALPVEPPGRSPNRTMLPPSAGRPRTIQPEPPEPDGFFSRLVRMQVPNWHIIGPTDFGQQVTHGLLVTDRDGHTAHLSYDPSQATCRLQVRLDGVRCTPILASPISRHVAGIPLVKVTFDTEHHAACVEAATLAWENSPPDRVLRALVKAVRAILDEGGLCDALKQ